jgi:hypothetical protein
MTRPGPAWTIAVALSFALALAGGAMADPPSLANLKPAGVPRGTATTLIVSGKGLAGSPRFFGPLPLVVGQSEPKEDGTAWTVGVTVPPETPVGVYPLRVVTEGGISNPMLLAVGQVPQVEEKEPNNTPDAAFALPVPPVVVEGEIAGADVDRFRFAGRKGQRIVVDAACVRLGSGVDPQLRLTTKAGAFVASADDAPGLVIDARLVAELPEDGEYLVELSDTKYAATGRGAYRLTVGPIPVAEEVYPLGGRAGETVGFELRGGTLGEKRIGAATVPGAGLGETAFRPRLTTTMLGIGGPTDPPLDVELPAALALGSTAEVREPADPDAPPAQAAAPAVLNGRLDPAGDEDRFRLTVVPGQRLRIRVEAADLGSAVDGVLDLLRPDGRPLASADDTTVPANQPGFLGRPTGAVVPDPTLTVTPPDGVTEILVALRDLDRDGGVGYPYRIVVEPVRPGVELLLGEGELTLPRGGSALLPVSLLRQEYTGPVVVSVANLPAGVTARGGAIEAGQAVGVISLHAAPDATVAPTTLDVVAVGKTDAGEVRARGARRLVFARSGDLPLNTALQVGLPAGAGEAGPVVLEAPDGPVEVVHGVKSEIPLTAKRKDAAKGGLKLTPLPLPPNVKVDEASLGDEAAEVKVPVTVALEAPVGTFAVGLTGKGKVAGADRTVATPAITLQVVRPASAELARDTVTIKAGETAELKGKVVRRGPFKEAVQVKLQGLPAGVEAPPVTVAPDASEFTLALTARPDAAAAEAKVQVLLGFKIGDKDYPTPPVPATLKVTK